MHRRQHGDTAPWLHQSRLLTQLTTGNKKTSKDAITRLIGLIVSLIALFLTIRFLPVQQWLRSFNDWVGQMGMAGIFIFIGVYAVATALMAPGSILTFGAGFAFGLWKGFLAVSAGATLGASLAFLVARFIAREKIAGSTTLSANKGRS